MEIVHPITDAAIASRADARAHRHLEVDRYDAVKQYSRGQVLAVWAAATAPMGILAWLVAPMLSHHLGGRDPFIEALLICFNTGLIWMLVLTLTLVRREQGSLEWTRVRDALWLRAPQNPKTKRAGGKVWWWVVPFTVLAAAFELSGIDPQGPLPRDLPNAIQTDRVEHFFSGAWGWFGLAVLLVFLAPLVEELLFRGLLLPRMRTAFGKRDWVANGTLFTLFHVHQPWSMPATLLDGIFAAAYPTKRYRSIWIGIVSHTAPSFIIAGVLLSLVLK